MARTNGASPRVQDPLGGPRLLIVDDQGPLCRALARGLRRDYDVTTALGGREARSLLAERSDFDVVLCDLSMPDVSGMDLYRWLLPRNPRLAALMVFLTGSRAYAEAEDFLEGLGNVVLDKPVDLDDLRRVLEGLLPRGARRRAGERPPAPEPRPV